METDKPLISILMAVYEPRMDWLREQLLSLDAQTYPNLKLYVRDDCSPTVPFDDIRDLVAECITKFPYQVMRNEQNLGSNLTFERLTREAEGSYFAYCDQDDVWLPEKLTRLADKIKEKYVLLVCSDVMVMDGQNNIVADSITRVRKRHVFQSGAGLTPGLIYRNFVIGCTMLVRAETAKAALPFAVNMIHDHYLALYCSTIGRIDVVTTPLVKYRMHDKNQTRVLAGVKTKEDYFRMRILLFYNRMAEIHTRFPDLDLEQTIRWVKARKDYYRGLPGSGKSLWALKHENYTTTIFEVVMLKMPECIFSLGLSAIKKGWI